jgi:ABC-type transport system substrate-binding protein
MRSTTRRMLATLALPAAAAIALTGCSAGGSGSTEAGDSNKLTLGMTADLTGGWDVVDQPSYQNWGIEGVYDNLVRCMPGGDIVPAAAESFEISEDRRSITAHLREGMKYSDGTPVDSASVQASFEVVKETASDRYGDITFDTPDDQTITISWPEPQPLMETRACSPYLASSDYLASDNRAAAPVGSGPYTLDQDSSTSGSVYSLVKNPDFYDADAYPYERVELRILADETASLNALKTGQVDGTIITAGSYDEAENGELEVLSSSAGLTMLHLTDRLGEKIPALGNVDVRRAMNMVIDKQSIVDSLYDGHAKPISQPFQEGSQAYIEDFEEPYPYDVDKAKQLMAKAGFEDGFTFTVPTMEGQAWTVMLPYVKQQLALLNITVEEEALSGPDAIAQLLSGDYPVPLWNVGGAGSLEDITVHVLPTGFWNVSHQADPTVDALWQQILTADEQSRVNLQQELNKYVIDQAWFVPILSPDQLYAYSPDITIDEITDPYKLHPRLVDFK